MKARISENPRGDRRPPQAEGRHASLSAPPREPGREGHTRTEGGRGGRRTGTRLHGAGRLLRGGPRAAAGWLRGLREAGQLAGSPGGNALPRANTGTCDLCFICPFTVV